MYMSTTIFAVPTPTVTISPQTIAYAGNNVTLRCIITLTEGVRYGISGSGSEVTVNSVWRKDGAILSNVDNRVIVGSTMEFGNTVFFNEIMFRPLRLSNDSANYTCEATLIPMGQLTNVNGTTASRSLLLTVQGEIQVK